MIVRMTHWTAKPGTDAESKRLWDDSVGAVWRSQPGLVRAHLLAQPDSQDRMTFSVWQSEDHYRKFVESDDLQQVAAAYAHVYEIDGGPAAAEWTVLTDDWDSYE